MTIREKILVIEDEKSISHFISTVLNNNGYEAMQAQTGEEAEHTVTFDRDPEASGPRPAGHGWSGHPPQPAQLVQPAGGGGLRPLP